MSLNHDPCQYIRGQGAMARYPRSIGAQIVGRGLSGLSISNNLKRDLLSLVEAVHSGAFDRADMHEDILAAVVGLNESEALLTIKPLDCSLYHGSDPSDMCKIKPRVNTAGLFRDFGRRSLVRRAGRGQGQVVRPKTRSSGYKVLCPGAHGTNGAQIAQAVVSQFISEKRSQALEQGGREVALRK